MPSLSSTYPELLHYTDKAGLEGIIKSQTIWAIDARYSNDASELKEFSKLLRAFLIPKAKTYIGELASQNPVNRKFIEQGGGINNVSVTSVNEFVQSIYTAWLGNQVAQPSAFAFITSFSYAKPKRIASHGVLSQWRGYCPNGGYAIVFDTLKLENLLREEGKTWEYELFGGDVIYSHQRRKFIKQQEESMKVLSDSYREWIVTREATKEFSRIFRPLIYCACGYKHWGFFEENEVRIVSAIPNKKLLTATEKDRYRSALKTINEIRKSDKNVPYIELLKGITKSPDKTLPIKRIIVGPGSDMSARHVSAESYVNQCGLDIKIVDSDIPYISVKRTLSKK